MARAMRRKHPARLACTVQAIHGVGEHISAASAGDQRMAVLDRALNVVFECYLDRRASTPSPVRLLP
ncbi:hypothetical protein GCM10023094_11090 [Rhodococcus olei]|uniref:TetR family transcriptional regulator n=1 Tax=Rhodococcus olei TaxID=2161675 RepID=A0ABP8NVA9_9NOCA